MSNTNSSRRQILAAVGGLGFTSLAGCTGGGDSDDQLLDLPASGENDESIDGRDIDIEKHYDGYIEDSTLRSMDSFSLIHREDSANTIDVDAVQVEIGGSNVDGTYDLSEVTSAEISEPGDEYLFDSDVFGTEPDFNGNELRINISYGTGFGQANIMSFDRGAAEIDDRRGEPVDGSDIDIETNYPEGDDVSRSLQLIHKEGSQQPVDISAIEIEIQGSNVNGVYQLSEATPAEISEPGDEFLIDSDVFGTEPNFSTEDMSATVYYDGDRGRRRITITRGTSERGDHDSEDDISEADHIDGTDVDLDINYQDGSVHFIHLEESETPIDVDVIEIKIEGTDVDDVYSLSKATTAETSNPGDEFLIDSEILGQETEFDSGDMTFIVYYDHPEFGKLRLQKTESNRGN